jgi:hypothetical protein
MRPMIQSWLKKVFQCAECAFVFTMLVLLVPLLLISAWLVVTAE